MREFIRVNVWPRYARKEEATKEQAQWAINKFILPEIGGVMCEDLEPWHCDAVLERVRDGSRWITEDGISRWEPGKARAGWSVRTVRKHLHRTLRLMARQKLIAYNYLEEIETDETEGETAVLTAQEAFSLWAEHRLEPIGSSIFLWAMLGLRRGEALARTAEDVGSSLLVRSQRVRNRKNGARDKTRLKTATSVREIPLSEAHEAILGAYAARGERICANTDGSPIYPTSVRKMLHTACRSSGLPLCSPQSLRSTFQSAMDEIGCPRGVLRAIVGHGAENVTDGYVVAREEAIRFWLGKFLEHASTLEGVQPGVPTAFRSGVPARLK